MLSIVLHAVTLHGAGTHTHTFLQPKTKTKPQPYQKHDKKLKKPAFLVFVHDFYPIVMNSFVSFQPASMSVVSFEQA